MDKLSELQVGPHLTLKEFCGIDLDWGRSYTFYLNSQAAAYAKIVPDLGLLGGELREIMLYDLPRELVAYTTVSDKGVGALVVRNKRLSGNFDLWQHEL